MDVSRETFERLKSYEGDVISWSAKKNLISKGDLETVWSRHILDCAQLATFAALDGRWIDLGSGAGLPGVVLALLADKSGFHMTLCEPNGKKASFLRQVCYRYGLRANVAKTRVEDMHPAEIQDFDFVTARAFQPLDRLMTLAYPILANDARGLFMKGEGASDEWDEANADWVLSGELHPAIVSTGSSIAVIDAVQRRS
ncbi:MAG: 16S rRNA (guanine(527)-N(7))-methyltransferase RsmG [Pseudomonadota bacterium]